MRETALLIPLAGRTQCWARQRTFLEQQLYDREKISLILLDTSQCDKFHSILTDWRNHCDYPEVIIKRKKIYKIPGLADLDRTQNHALVNQTMVKLYNLAKYYLLGSEYVWILEDDVIPPLDAYLRLVRHLLPNVLCISAAYHMRGSSRWTIWRDTNQPTQEMGVGVEAIRGCGFGCVLFKTIDFLRLPLTYSKLPVARRDEPWGFDMESLFRQTRKILVNWDIICEHLSERDLPIHAFGCSS